MDRSTLSESPPRLTSFAPHSEDAKQSNSIFSRIFRGKPNCGRPGLLVLDSGSGQTSAGETLSVVNEDESDAGLVSEASSIGDTVSETADAPPPVSEVLGDTDESSSSHQGRTLPSVLRRLSRIVAGRSQTPQAYKDSDFKQYWMPDSNCHQCYECGERFTTFRRRHHCRICGQIFCSYCCNQVVPGRIMGYTGELRVCKYCCEVALQYAKNPDISHTPDESPLPSRRSTLESSRGGSVPRDLGSLGRAGRLDGSSGLNQPSSGSRDGSLVGSARRTSKVDQASYIFDEEQQPTGADSSGFCTPDSILNQYRDDHTALLEDCERLRELWMSLRHKGSGVEVKSREYRSKIYNNCMHGSDIVDWLINNNRARTREQAISIGQTLLVRCWMERVQGSSAVSGTAGRFRDDFAVYCPTEMALQTEAATVAAVISGQDSVLDSDEENEPNWVREIRREDVKDESETVNTKIASTVSAPDHVFDANTSYRSVFYVDSPVTSENSDPTAARHGSFSYTTPTHLTGDRQSRGSMESSHGGLNTPGVAALCAVDSQGGGAPDLTSSVSQGAIAEGGVQISSSSSSEAGSPGDNSTESDHLKLLSKIHKDHTVRLLDQLLKKEGLSPCWSDVILSVAQKVSQTVRPDVRYEGDDMDIRQYVRIKKIPGGSRSNTSVVYGVVCTKSVAHKKMKLQISNPRILLLRSSIEYQRVENKFCSLEPQILQEHEFLKNSIARIAALRPDILMVEKTVSRLAQGFLLDAGITLILNVKTSVMQRVARLTMADVVTSIDGLVGRTILGHCHNFYTKTFPLPDGSSKSLLYFEGCPAHLGCTVTLRGAEQAQELRKVKKIMSFMTYSVYHSNLELSFLSDELACVPPLIDDNQSEAASEDFSCNDENGLPDLVTSDMFQNVTSTPASDKSETKKVELSLETSTRSIFDDDDEANAIVVTEVKKIDNDDTSSASASCDDDSSTAGAIIINVPDSSCSATVQQTDNAAIQQAANVTVQQPTNSTVQQPALQQQANEVIAADDHPLATVPFPAVSPINDKTSEKSGIAECVLRNPLLKPNEDRLTQSLPTTEGELKRKRPPRPESKFSKVLPEVLLSVSPLIRFQPPHLESNHSTESGSCNIPQDIFWSQRFKEDLSCSKSDDNLIRNESDSLVKANDISAQKINSNKEDKENKIPKRVHPLAAPSVNLQDAHPFVRERIKAPVSDPNIQALLADFRARGGTIPYEACLIGQMAEPFNQSDSQKSSGRRQHGFSTSAAAVLDPETGLVDCLDPINHQRIALLFSSFSPQSPNAPAPCVFPWTVNMRFYARASDVTLGGFLEKYCFSETYRCVHRNCDTPMLDHIRRFVHGNACIQVNLKKLDNLMSSTNSGSGIITWTWCRQCRKVGPVTPLSSETYSMSFGKYLELRFHAERYMRQQTRDNDGCHHSLNRDHFHYFAQNQTVASFKYVSIKLKEICLAPIIIKISPPNISPETLLAEGIILDNRTNHTYCDILKQLLRLKAEASTEQILTYVSELTIQLERELESVLQKIEYVTTLIRDINRIQEPSAILSICLQCSDAYVEIKHQLAEAVLIWNDRIHDIDSAPKKPDKSGKSNASQASLASLASSQSTILTQQGSSADLLTDRIVVSESSAVAGNPSESSQSLLSTSCGTQSVVDSACSSSLSTPVKTGSTQIGDESSEEAGKSSAAISEPLVSSPSQVTFQIDLDSTKTSENSKQDSAVVSGNSSNVVTVGLSTMESEKRKEEKTTVKQIFSNLLSASTTSTTVTFPYPADEHHQLDHCGALVPLVVSDQEPSSIIAYALSSHNYKVQLKELKTQVQALEVPGRLRRFRDSSEQIYQEINVQRNRKSPKQLDSSLSPNIDQEPSEGRKSVLAFLKGHTTRDKSPSHVGSVESVKYVPGSTDRESAEFTDVADGLKELKDMGERIFQYSTLKSLPTAPACHLEMQFSDNTTKFYCKASFAMQFEHLRKLIFPDGEERYIRSLSRCFTWLARGGKSGSSFCKTQDDRFILKQMSKNEVQSFNEFAPNYFDYIARAHALKSPVLLTKILGVYKIGYQNANSALKQDLLVMENLFYGRKISQIYDLKGSARNREVALPSKQTKDIVLLDQNFLKASVDSPLYIHPDCKSVLMKTIHNDTEFLARNLVMDYSLLVGVDESNDQLVTGIIDLIRTFTWDKKVEMLVKTTYSGHMPTVVSPDVYRRRFVEAMDRYFLSVPDQWHGLNKEVSSNMTNSVQL